MAGRAYRFFSITTGIKRAKFRAVYADALDNKRSILDQIAIQQACELGNIDGGISVKQSSANGHNIITQDPGSATAAPQEFVEMWEELARRVEDATRFLTQCNKYGLDAFNTTHFPSPLPTPANPAVIVDPTGEWSLLCLQYEEAESGVIGAPLDQPAIFLWVINKLQAVTAGMNDYGMARIAPGPAYY